MASPTAAPSVPDVSDLSVWLLVGRGVLRRCAACGGGDLFERWFTMRPACPTCGLDLAPEEGWELGAMTVNTIVTYAAMLMVGLGFVVTAWPDVDLFPGVAVVVGVALVVPIVFYPFSKTIWIAIDLAFDRFEPDDGRGNVVRVTSQAPVPGDTTAPADSSAQSDDLEFGESATLG